MDDDTAQAEAAIDQNQTATGNTAQADTAADANAIQPTPTALTEQEVEGMDAKAYGEALEKIRNGELEAQAQQAAQDTQPPAQATEEEEAKKSPDRIRLTDFDEREKQAITLARDMKKAGTPISLAEAAKRVEALYAGDAPAADDTTKPADNTPATPEGIEAQIVRLKAERKEAARNVDTERMEEIQDQIDAAREQLEGARQTAEQESQRINAEIKAVSEQMRTRYPEFARKDSPLSQKWQEVHDKLQDEGHPILSNPVEATRYITLLAADELGIAPVASKKASAPITSTPAKARPPVQPGSGALRTVTPTDNTGQLEQRVEGVKSMTDYERLKEEMFAKSA